MSESVTIPIDPPMSTSAVLQLSMHDMQTRNLNDPRYAGFDPKFDWHALVSVVISDPALKTAVTQAMDRMAQTPEGQQTLRQAYALHQTALQDPIVQQAMEGAGPKLGITDHYNASAVDNDNGSNSLPYGIVHIDPRDAVKYHYPGEDGKRHDLTMDHVIYHEFAHLKDAFNVLPAYADARQHYAADFAQAKADIKREAGLVPDRTYTESELKPEIYRKLDQAAERASSITEYPTMLDTNSYITQYNHGAARAMIHTARPGAVSEMEPPTSQAAAVPSAAKSTAPNLSAPLSPLLGDGPHPVIAMEESIAHGHYIGGKHGANAAAVTELRGDMDTLGISHETHGHYSANERSAITGFQKEHHLQIDGIVGPQTLAALQEAIHGLKGAQASNATNASDIAAPAVGKPPAQHHGRG